MDSPPERAPRTRTKVGEHAAWAMAVGGMIGGGIFTLAGLILGAAGSLAWLSLLLGGAIALVTVRSYARLTIATGSGAIPLTIFTIEGRQPIAGILAWCLVFVYVLALAVYTFTAGHYLGRALGLDARGIAACEALIIGALVLLNLRGVQHPASVQIAAVWIGLASLAALAGIGLWEWNPDNLTRGMPAASISGVIVATAGTFIAFEGFEMLAYDVRDIRRPRHVLRAQLPRAVIVVAVAYALVTVGAASLVGADALVHHKENALAVAGDAAAGTAGLIIMTVAACLAATSAVNATLFSVARLARGAAEARLLPQWCARSNQHDAPVWSILVIATAAVIVAATTNLEPLVATASLGFLSLFFLVNVLALRRLSHGRWSSLAGAVGAGGAVVVLIIELVRTHPVALATAFGVLALGVVLHVVSARLADR